MTLTNLRRYSILLSKNFGKFEHVNDVSLRKKPVKTRFLYGCEILSLLRSKTMGYNPL
jgi:hypothetical protein